MLFPTKMINKSQQMDQIIKWMKDNCSNYPYLCSTAACVLATILGNQAVLCEGYNECEPHGLHFWVEYNDEILDPTAEQFNGVGKYVATEKGLVVPQSIKTLYSESGVIAFLETLKSRDMHNRLVYW